MRVSFYFALYSKKRQKMENGNYTILLQFYGIVLQDQYCRTSGFTWETIIKMMSFAIDFDLYSKKRQKIEKNKFFHMF